jgi:hypothetical protein
MKIGSSEHPYVSCQSHDRGAKSDSPNTFRPNGKIPGAENPSKINLGSAVSGRATATTFGIFQKVIQVPERLLTHESMSWRKA